VLAQCLADFVTLLLGPIGPRRTFVDVPPGVVRQADALCVVLTLQPAEFFSVELRKRVAQTGRPSSEWLEGPSASLADAGLFDVLSRLSPLGRCIHHAPAISAQLLERHRLPGRATPHCTRGRH
jgi:hypothetical protein